MNEFPFMVAVNPGRVSAKVIVTALVYVPPLVTPINVGSSLSIQSIVFVACNNVQVFPLEYHAPVVNGHVPR